MKTIILKPTQANIQKAANTLKQGLLVGMPTETVYGLAANALDSQAVASIFVAKNRPQDNPLIVHVHAQYDLSHLVYITPLAKQLIAAFSPGPITFVMQSKGTVSPLVSCGLDSLAVRIPEHDIAQSFLRACNLPVAAPSANLSTRMSATTAQAVKAELNGKLTYIINGGMCQIGVESTVVDVRGSFPIILRPGKISAEMLSAVASKVQDKSQLQSGQAAHSPGQKYAHYAPSCPVFLAPEGGYGQIKAAYTLSAQKGNNPVVLCLKADKQIFAGFNTLCLGNNTADYAKNLYETLRKAEQAYNQIYLLAVPNNGLGSALMNRLAKVCGNNLLT